MPHDAPGKSLPSSPPDHPIKGILKRSPNSSASSDVNRTDRTSNELPASHLHSSSSFSHLRPDTLNNQTPALSLPNVSQSRSRVVEFAPKNAVAIYGDTSDETEPELNRNWRNALGSLIKSSSKKEQDQKQRSDRMSEVPIPQIDLRESTEEKTLIQRTSEKDSSIELELFQRGGLIDPELDNVEIASTSDSSVSHIAGKWWFGRSTKFVLHCDRKCHGGKHDHGSEKTNEYMTPTQRKNKEITDLRKELRNWRNLAEERNKQLFQMRERLKEIEEHLILPPSSSDERLSLLKKQLEDNFAEERRVLQERHEFRIRQLLQVEFDLRSELSKKEQFFKEERKSKSKELKDVFTDMDDFSLSENVDTSFSFTSAKDAAMETANSEIPEAFTSQSVDKNMIVETVPSPPTHQPPTQPDSLVQIEAYRSEAFIWRMKCVQLEMTLRDMLLKIPNETSEVNELINGLGPLDHSTSMNGDQQKPIIISPSEKSYLSPGSDRNIIRNRTPTPPRYSGECQNPSCIEKKNQLDEEINNLQTKLEEKENLLDEYNSKLLSTENKIDSCKKELQTFQEDREELAVLAERRIIEVQVVQMELAHLKAEKYKLDQAFSYLETRCQALQNVVLDNGLIVEVGNWRVERGILDQPLVVHPSQNIQTVLTMSVLKSEEMKMQELGERLLVTEKELLETREKMHESVRELEENITFKNNLINSLASQLKSLAKESQTDAEQRQKERDTFCRRIEELARIAEKVPILESEIEHILSEKSLCELKLRKFLEHQDTEAEKALNSHIQRANMHEEYWREKVDNLERARSEALVLLQKLQKQFESAQLANIIQRTELEQRLASSIEHISLLNNRLNCPKSDVQCEAKPQTINKFVSCRPYNKERSTSIGRKDLPPDEELENCRRGLDLAVERIEELQDQLSEALRKIYASKSRSRETVVFDKANCEVILPVESSEDGISIVSSPTVLYGLVDTGNVPIENTDSELEKKTHKKVRHGSLDFNIKSKHDKRIIGYEKKLIPDGTKTLKMGIPSVVVTNEDGIDRRGILSSFLHLDETQPEFAIPARGSVEELRIHFLDIVRAGIATATHSPQNEKESESSAIKQVERELEKMLRSIIEHEQKNYSRMLMETSSLREEAKKLNNSLRQAEMELEIYRMEPRSEAWQRQLIFGDKWKSTSSDQLGPPTIHKRQLDRWKEIAGVTFREVNRLRHDLEKLQTQCMNQKSQISILRGEMVLMKCEMRNQTNPLSITGMKRKGSLKEIRDGQQSDYNFWMGSPSTNPYYNRWLGNRWQSVPDVGDLLDESSWKVKDNTLKKPKTIFYQQQKQQHFSDKEKQKSLGGAKLELIHEAFQRQIKTLESLRTNNTRLESNLKNLQDNTDEINKILAEKDEKMQFQNEELKAILQESMLLKAENEMYEKKVNEIERERQQMYLIMFKKGQQAANMEANDIGELDQITEERAVLKFLHDAFFYYLSNKGNTREHLQVIMTMLDFTNEQKEEVYKRRGKSH